VPRGFIVRFGIALVLAFVVAAQAPALDLFQFCSRDEVVRLNQKLAGRVVDYTHNHGCDRRLYSNALGEKRDAYVYLPPGYDGIRQFPAVLWLHGLGSDERSFLELAVIFDQGIRTGTLPPAVIIAPDGSIRGHPSLFNSGSFYINSNAGNYADYIVQDMWGFLKANYAVRPEREAHLIVGASMGGFGAYNLGFKHKAEFANIAGIMPPLNLRYADVQGNYFGNFSPGMATFRTELPRNAIIGRFYGFLLIRSRRITDPLLGRRHPDPVAFVSRENPIEMLAAYDVKPGDYEMFLGYGTRDEFNIDAQVLHFVEVARSRGIEPFVHCLPNGRHNISSGVAMVPAMSAWAKVRLGPYAPPSYSPGGACGSTLPSCAIRQPTHFSLER